MPLTANEAVRWLSIMKLVLSVLGDGTVPSCSPEKTCYTEHSKRWPVQYARVEWVARVREDLLHRAAGGISGMSYSHQGTRVTATPLFGCFGRILVGAQCQVLEEVQISTAKNQAIQTAVHRWTRRGWSVSSKFQVGNAVLSVVGIVPRHTALFCLQSRYRA